MNGTRAFSRLVRAAGRTWCWTAVRGWRCRSFSGSCCEGDNRPRNGKAPGRRETMACGKLPDSNQSRDSGGHEPAPETLLVGGFPGRGESAEGPSPKPSRNIFAKGSRSTCQWTLHEPEEPCIMHYHFPWIARDHSLPGAGPKLSDRSSRHGRRQWSATWSLGRVGIEKKGKTFKSDVL